MGDPVILMYERLNLYITLINLPFQKLISVIYGSPK